ncbi:MAG: DoxX family protein [Fluviicola sp.]|nr:DoxX family protein [Fluviicola sp.]
MKEAITIQGRSLIFNTVFVVLNLAGLALLTIGYHENFVEHAALCKMLAVILMMGSIGGLIIFKGKKLMASVARVLVGGLFIVSGLVKANDPIGFAYKLEEYFEDGALAFRIKEWFGTPEFSLEFFIDYALPLSVIICIVEIILGVLVIIGGKVKLVSYSMMAMMVFFTFLTWHTSNCDASIKFLDRDTYEMSNPVAQMRIDEANEHKDDPDYGLKIVSQNETTLVVDEMKQPQCVTDCGCFGDAMKGSVGRSLSPEESFWKDIILVYLILWIFVSQRIIQPNNRKENMVFVSTSMVVILFFSWIFGWYFPLFFGIFALLGSLWLLRAGGKIFGNHYGVALFVTIICSIMVAYVLMYLPLKDYRAYAVGSNLEEKMNDGVEGEYESMLVYKNKETGETKEYSSTSPEYTKSKIWEDKDWVYESMIQKVIIPTKLNSITEQFNPFIDVADLSEYELSLPSVADSVANAKMQGLKILAIEYNSHMEVPMEEYNETDYPAESYTIVDTIEIVNPSFTEISIRDLIVKAEKIVLVSSKSLEKGDWRNIDKLKAIFEECQKNNIPFAVMCNANRNQINEFRTEHQFFAPFFVNDETELKAISRSNPSLIVVEKGIIKAKYPFRSTPSKEQFVKEFLK